MFLDSASLKVCDFTVLTLCIPVHLSFPVCPVLCTAGLKEHPDKTTGWAVPRVSVGGLLPRNGWENKKNQHLPKVSLSMPSLDPPLSTCGRTDLVT